MEITLLHRNKHALFIFVYLINIFHQSVGVTLIVNGYGQKLNTTGPLLSPLGPQQCVRECLRKGDCQSVNYWRDQLRCQLNPAVVGPGSALVPDPSGVYMEKSSQPLELLPGPCSTISCAQTCSEMSNGGRSFCGPAVRDININVSVDCPAGFLWRPAASLCYKATDSAMTWTDANAYCTSIGARLAKLDTPEKITIVDNDYIGGAFATFQYYIGGSVVTSEWRWVDGTLIDHAFLTSYGITLSDGQCLLWDNTYRLSQYACTFSFYAFCEVPVTTDPYATSQTTTTAALEPLATTCPSNFRWDATVHLCYYVEENGYIWQVAKTNCESMGARLAILDTAAKLDLIFNDYMYGFMHYWQYFIGGYFDDTVADWRWINGSLIDPNHLMNYPVAGGPEICLLWTDVFYLYDYPCDSIYPSICEIPITVCPSNFRWDATVNLCYFVDENEKTWQDAKTHCESMSARLAILDTHAKLDVIFNDYMGAMLLYYNYYIGGSFDDTIADWKWVNGSVIDSSYYMSYAVSGGSGTCLLWSDIYYLRDYPCDILLPSICEIPFPP